MFSKRDLAKDTATAVVAGVTAKTVTTSVDSFTEIDSDSTPVSIGSTVVGLIVSWKVKPLTDACVDNVADRWQARKARKNDTE